MSGCLTCGKKKTAVIPTVPTGQIPTGNVIWDGTAFSCPTDPTLDTVVGDSLNTVLLRLLNDACTDGGCCLVTTSHTALTTLINTTSLVPNTIYRFPYATKHLIAGTSAIYNDTTAHYDPGTAVKATFVPQTEWIWVRALTATEVHVEVYSESHPRDIIYYDVADVLTEDGLQSRPGFITYREDPDKDVSTHFDFRNVLHRRWDMDQTLATRDPEYKLALGDDVLSAYNHDITYGSGGAGSQGSIPAFTNFDNGGNADLGMVATANNTGFRDFKTFVGYDEILYKTPVAEAPRYRNVHIKKSDAVAKVIGSASGDAVTLTNAGTVGGAYPFFANVVIFARSVENVSIGENATGIMITGRAVRELRIGHNNENIIIGGMQSSPFYTVPTEPLQYGFNEHITIGDNNRNIMISDANRRINIGNSNIGILSNKFGYNNDIGSFNTNVYLSYSNENVIGDWCQTIRISGSNNIEIGSQGNIIDVVKSQASGSTPNNPLTSFAKNIPDGFNNVSADVEASNTKIEIGNACSELFLAGVFGAKIGSQNQKGFIMGCSGLVMGTNNFRFDLNTSQALIVGSNNIGLEVVNSTSSKIDDYCSNIKVLNSGYIDIGDGCSYSMIANGSTSVTLGKFCSSVVAWFNQRVELGVGVSLATLRSCSDLEIGSQSTDLYFETASGSVGSYCTAIVVNTIGLTMRPTFVNDFALYNYALSDSRIANASARTYVGAGNPTNSIEINTSLATYISAPGALVPTTNNTIGNGCSEVVITGCSGNVVGNGSSYIYIGVDAPSSLDYPLTFTAGIADPAGSTPAYTIPNISGLAVIDGYNCQSNVVGEKCSYIKIRGVGQNNNEFAAQVTLVEAVPGFAFTNNRVLVDGKTVTLTAIYDKKIYDKRSPDNERWETGIDNAGAATASTKLA